MVPFRTAGHSVDEPVLTHTSPLVLRAMPIGLAAWASFSKRKDVIAVFTLSEETLIVRKWKNGVFVDQFFPHEDNSNIGE